MCRAYIKETILPKNMFSCPLKLIVGFSGIFYVFGYKSKYWYTIMCEYENSPLSHEWFEIKLFNVSHLIIF